MNKRHLTSKQILDALCRSKPELVKTDGAINQNAVQRHTGVNQPTVKRILDGESRNVSDANVTKFAKYFNISKAQFRGEEPIPGITSEDNRTEVSEPKEHYSTERLPIARELWEKLTKSQQKQILDLVKTLADSNRR